MWSIQDKKNKRIMAKSRKLSMQKIFLYQENMNFFQNKDRFYCFMYLHEKNYVLVSEESPGIRISFLK